MSNPTHMLARAGLGVVLMGCAFALPAWAADQGRANDTTMPATEHQAESMRSVPDEAAGTRTGEQVPQAGEMPATKAQKEELKEDDHMSHDGAGKHSTPDTHEGRTHSDTSEGSTD